MVMGSLGAQKFVINPPGHAHKSRKSVQSTSKWYRKLHIELLHTRTTGLQSLISEIR